MEHILPVINLEDLQNKANQSAQKGAMEAIEKFYTSYDSPYKKAIEENLKEKGLNGSIKIPDIVGLLNNKINDEISKIANTAVANTFIPYVVKMLTNAEPIVKLSKILKTKQNKAHNAK